MGVIKKSFQAVATAIASLKPDDTILFVMRHGHSLGQVDIRHYKERGDDCLPLTHRGVQQAQAAGGVLSALAATLGFNDMRIITSTGERCTMTATELFRSIGATHSKSVTYDRRLDKQRFGNFDGLFSDEERRAHHPIEYSEYKAQLAKVGAFNVRPPAGESIADVQNRISTLASELEGTHMPTILVTHGTNALCVENALMNKGESWVLKNVDTRPNCSIRLLAGNPVDGFTAHTVTNDPVGDLAQAKEWSASRHQRQLHCTA